MDQNNDARQLSAVQHVPLNCGMHPLWLHPSEWRSMETLGCWWYSKSSETKRAILAANNKKRRPEGTWSELHEPILSDAVAWCRQNEKITHDDALQEYASSSAIAAGTDDTWRARLLRRQRFVIHMPRWHHQGVYGIMLTDAEEAHLQEAQDAQALHPSWDLVVADVAKALSQCDDVIAKEASSMSPASQVRANRYTRVATCLIERISAAMANAIYRADIPRRIWEEQAEARHVHAATDTNSSGELMQADWWGTDPQTSVLVSVGCRSAMRSTFLARVRRLTSAALNKSATQLPEDVSLTDVVRGGEQKRRRVEVSRADLECTVADVGSLSSGNTFCCCSSS